MIRAGPFMLTLSQIVIGLLSLVAGFAAMKCFLGAMIGPKWVGLPQYKEVSHELQIYGTVAILLQIVLAWLLKPGGPRTTVVADLRGLTHPAARHRVVEQWFLGLMLAFVGTLAGMLFSLVVTIVVGYFVVYVIGSAM